MNFHTFSNQLSRKFSSTKVIRSLPNIFYNPSKDFVVKNSQKVNEIPSILRKHPNVNVINTLKGQILAPLAPSSSLNDRFFVGPVHSKRDLRRAAHITN